MGIRACPKGGPPRSGAAFRTGSPSRIGPFQPLDAELRILGVSPIVENHSFKGRLTRRIVWPGDFSPPLRSASPLPAFSHHCSPNLGSFRT